MIKVAEEVKRCKRCELWRSRRNPVPGEGNPDANIMLVGEAPGRNEDLQGRPFVGAAGRLLDSLLEGVGLSRSQVFIGNVLKCRPPNNRDPLQSEVEACTPFLDDQIRIIRPKLIVALGRYSANYLLGKAGLRLNAITSIRGRMIQADLLGLKVLILPTLHPAAALYNPKLKDALREDFQLLSGWLRTLAA